MQCSYCIWCPTKKGKDSICSEVTAKIGCTGLTERWCIGFQPGTSQRDSQGQICQYSTFALPADSRHHSHLRCHLNCMALHATLEKLSDCDVSCILGKVFSIHNQ